LNKGIVVKKVLRIHDLPDFIFCVGDDISDEKMFTSVLSIIAQAHDSNLAVQNPKYAFTVTVGKKVSNASFFVESSTDVADLLVDLSGITVPSMRSMSWDETNRDFSMFE
jgi:trehalose 6-phosphate synthase/phosphatase